MRADDARAREYARDDQRHPSLSQALKVAYCAAIPCSPLRTRSGGKTLETSDCGAARAFLLITWITPTA
eukprot:592216-Prymnesium_polylepis.1